MPELEGVPVIVLSNNDGCSICHSKECDRFGVKMGSPIFEMEHLVRQYDIKVFSTNFPLIADISLRVKSILQRFCPSIEDYSIDEVFLDFKGFTKEATEKTCRDIVHIIKKGLGLPISIGIAPTKTLAKVACKFAKKHKGYEGVCIIDNEDKRIKALQKTQISDIWGIGYQHSKRLQNIGVKTALNFTEKPTSWVRKEMTVTGERTYRELKGEPCIQMELEQPAKKNIMISRSFGTMLPDLETISEAVVTYECMGAAKLRRQNSNAKALYVFLHTNPFREDLPQRFPEIVLHLPVATSSSIEIAKYVKEALKAIYKPGYMYKKAGVMMMDLSDKNSVQLNLFDTINRKKHNDLMETMDFVNNKYGRNTLALAAQGDGKKWKIRQEKLPPYYTTRWSDLLVAY